MTDLVPVSDGFVIANLVEQVGRMDVTDAASNEEAGAILNDIVGLRKALEERATEMRRATEKMIATEAKPYIVKLKDAEDHLRGLVGGYLLARKREAEAEEAAREEALERAIATDPEHAQEALESLMVPVVREKAPDGIRLTGRWEYEVTDFPALVRAVAAGDYPMTLLQPSPKELGALARAFQSSSKIPGVRVWKESGNLNVRGTR